MAVWKPGDLKLRPTSGTGRVTSWPKEVMAGAPYSVILADPPWPDKPKDQPGANMMAPPYPTMKANELTSLPIRQLVGESAILIMWCTWAHLELGLKVIKAWGFEYASGMPWLKVDATGSPSFGQGLWFRHCTEIVTVSRKGNSNKLYADAGLSRSSREGLVIAERRGHSRKPDEVHQWIEQTMPEPYIELFARRERRNWTTWGNQVLPADATEDLNDENDDEREE